MEDALEAGASDFQADEDVFEIYTEPEDFSGVRDDLEAKGYHLRLRGDPKWCRAPTPNSIDPEHRSLKMQQSAGCAGG